MKTYITNLAPSGEEIKFDFKPNNILLMITNFDPMHALGFVDNIEKVKGIDRVTIVHRYDDGTGSMVVKLSENYNKGTVTYNVIEAFENHFSAQSISIENK